MAKAGALGCKAFMVHSGIDDFPDCREEHLRAAMPELRDSGMPLLVHAELELTTSEPSSPRTTYAHYLASRPAAWEEAAIARMVRLCRETECRVHVVHLSAAGALPMIADAKREGLPFSVESCPHYLCLRAEDIADGATAFKCAPPIREEHNREGLWRGLSSGIIDLVVSDH